MHYCTVQERPDSQSLPATAKILSSGGSQSHTTQPSVDEQQS
jgi:hypothetical protein